LQAINSGAAPALRGYRKQFLYTLGRIIKADVEVFYPEKIEDLSVYDDRGKLVEIIQVKDHSKPLSFSVLKSFFDQATTTINEHPDVSVTLANYGTLGPELKSELDKKEAGANSKFCDVRKAIQRLYVQKLDETEELRSIIDFLSSQPTLSGDAQSAFDILMQSLYRGSEIGQSYSKQSVLEHIQKIGIYLIGREAHHQEWGSSILPLEANDGYSKIQLREEFCQGVGARWEHIVSGIDTVRPQYLESIEEGFRNNNIVIIHGASGQGKSTLAYRFLYDFCSAATRYEIRDISTPERALKISAALRGYESGLPVPLIFYADVSYADKGLAEILKQVVDMPHIQLLLTIREEDWRLVSLSKADLKFTDIELDFNVSEAQQLFDCIENNFPDFSQAWAQFGGEGPLLEFVYLLNHTENLRDRLEQQYNRIADNIEYPDDLKVLEYVAVAGSCGARIDLRKLKELIPQVPLKRIIDRLESEYLIRQNIEGASLSSLHSIRAGLLTGIFIDPVIKSWPEMALKCLPVLLDEDFEPFLLHIFINHPEAEETILPYVRSTRFHTWTGVGGVVRALLWKGVYDYIRNNQELINEVRDDIGDGIWLILDFDLVGILEDESGGAGILDILPAEGQVKAKQWRSQQLPKAEAFTELNSWLRIALFPTQQCKDESDWRALGETAYWVGFGKLETNLYDTLDWEALTKFIDTLPLDVLGTLIYGIWNGFSNRPLFSEWYNQIRPKLLERFQDETLTPFVEMKDEVIRAHFIVPIEESEDVDQEIKKGISLHQQGVEHIELLAQLFPQFEGFGCQGYGHMLFDFIEHDDTIKSSVSSTYLRPDWVTQVNKTARILSGYESRPETWREYCDQMLGTRQGLVHCMNELRLCLSKHFRSKKPVQQLISLPDSIMWKKVSQQVARTPSFPLEALDQWGFTEEGGDSSDLEGKSEQSNKSKEVRSTAHLQRYRRYLKIKSKVFDGVSNFLNQAPDFIVANSHLGKAKTVDEKKRIQEVIKSLNLNLDKPFIVGYNLSEAIIALPEFQRLYRHHFAGLTDLRLLDKLEQEEQQVLNSIWCFWYFFINDSSHHWNTPGKAVAAQLEKRKVSIRERIKQGLERASTDDVVIKCLHSSPLYENEPALWVTIDGENPIDVYNQFEEMYKQILVSLGEIKLHSIDYYALQFQFSHLVVLPLVRGKLLERSAWVLPNYKLVSELNSTQDLSQLNYLPHPIDADVLINIGLDIWKTPQLSEAKALFEGVAKLQVQLLHMVQVGKIPGLDKSEGSVAQVYFASLQEITSQHMQQVFDSSQILENQYQEALCDLPEGSVNEYIEEAYHDLAEIYDDLFPPGFQNGKAELDIEKMEEWQKKLVTIQGDVFEIYLKWATYLVSV